MKKRLALYGGSFNPSTKAHRAIGVALLEQLPVDEVWYLVSPQSPFKSKEGMASFAQRVAMARINVEGHDRLVVKTIEEKYARSKPEGIINTSDTLMNLTRDFPDHRFIWVMGADNFADFHTWGGSEYIVKNYPIAVIPRQGYTEAARNSVSAGFSPRLDVATDLRDANGWYLLDVKENDINATSCREELAEGLNPACMRPEVALYARKNRIYAPLTMNRC